MFFLVLTEFEVDFPNLTTLKDGALSKSGITKILDLGNITAINPGIDLNENNAWFSSCKNLTFVKLKETITSIGNNAFNRCENLATVICYATTPPTLATSSFDYTNSVFKIYVPDDSVEAYKVATNWVNYASRIHPLSEYTEDE